MAAMDVQVGALLCGPNRDHVAFNVSTSGDDLDPPTARVADDLAAAGRDDLCLVHARSL